MRTLMWGLLAIAVAAIGYFIWRGRNERLAEEQARRDALASGTKGVEDMRECPKCGAYVPVKDAKPCGKAECPAALSLPKSGSGSRSGGGNQA
jgi:hypothetical protein